MRRKDTTDEPEKQPLNETADSADVIGEGIDRNCYGLHGVGQGYSQGFMLRVDWSSFRKFVFREGLRAVIVSKGGKSIALLTFIATGGGQVQAQE